MSELNVQQLLINFGAWVRDDNNDLGYGNPFNAILAAAPHLADDEEDCEQPVQFKNASHMTDLDAAIVDHALTVLYKRRMHSYIVIRQIYIKGWSKRKLAERLGIPRNQVDKDLCTAEGRLDMILNKL